MAIFETFLTQKIMINLVLNIPIVALILNCKLFNNFDDVEIIHFFLYNSLF